MPQEWIEQLARRTRTSKTRRLYEDGLPTRKYSWDGVVGTSLHYPDAGGAWQDVDVNAEEPDTDGFTVKFTELPYFARIAEDGRRRIYLDRNDLSYWIEFGKPFPSMGTPSRFERWFHWDFPHARIGVRFDPDSIKFGFRLKDYHAPTSITIPFETEGITREGRLLYHDGEVVGALRRPIATGSNLDEFGMPAQKDCDIVFAPGEVTISLDPTGLEYPIDIDPTVDKQVAASADDGYSDDAGAFFPVYSVAYIGQWGGKVRESWYRFIGITGLAGATISVANIQVYGHEYQDGASPKTKIWAEDAESPVAPTSAANHAAKTRTSAGVDWDVVLTADDWNTSPSIVSVIQELANSYNPTAIQILHDDDGSGNGNIQEVKQWDFGDNTYGAKLHIEYTAGGAPITLTPTAGTFAIIAVNPTVALGTLTMTPTAASLPIVAADPVMQLTYTVVPTVVASPVIAPAPSLALSLAISPSATVIPIIAADPLIAIDQFFTPTPATMPLAIPNPAISLTLALLPTPAGSPIVAADPTLTLTLTMAPTAATIPIATPAPTIALGTLSLTPTAATIPMAIANPIVALTLALSPTPAAIPIVVAVPTMGLTFELSPVVIPLVVANPALSLSLSLATTPATIPLVAADPALSLSLSLLPSPAAIPLLAVDPVLGLSLALVPTPATIPLLAADPVLGISLTLATTPAILPLVVADPGLVLTLVLVSTPATIPLAIANPVVIIAGGVLTLLPLAAVLNLIAPSIIIARPQGFTLRERPADYRLVERMPDYELEALPADYRIEELRW